MAPRRAARMHGEAYSPRREDTTERLEMTVGTERVAFCGGGAEWRRECVSE